MSDSLEKSPILPPDQDINFFAATNFRNISRKFGIKLDDRRRHMYVVGKTGMGKTTLLENMVLNDIYNGHGVGVVDPHGDFAEKIINFIPPNRINDVVYFNPSDIDFPIGFNILESIDPRYRHLVASGLMGVFKKIWPDVWSARMEYILNNTLLALLEFPNTTLLGINRLLADDAYRKRVVRNLKDPVIKSFWETEFAGYNDKYKQEAVAPIQNKIGQFLSASVIRNIVAQVKSRINIREIMDSRKIFIMNLSKGRIGEDNSRLLGGMLITKIQLAAMERVDTPERDRKDFFLYVDEFQNFATESFSNILSEARKYRLDLIMAHQYMEQLEEEVLAAVIGNVGTLVTFRVGSTDAEILAKEFAPTFLETDLVNLTKFQIYLKLMIDGVASQPFSADTLAPINLATDSEQKVVRVSRERYAIPRDKIEDKIMRWTGMESSTTSDPDGDELSDEGDVADGDLVDKKPKEEDEYTEDEEGMPVLAFAPKKDIIASVSSKPVGEQKVAKPRTEPLGGSGTGEQKKIENQPQVKPRQEQQRKPDNRNQNQQNNQKQNQSQNQKPKQNNNQGNNRDRDRDRNRNQDQDKKKLDIKQSQPVSLVDTSQKGISLSQAMHSNKQSESTNQNQSSQPKKEFSIEPEIVPMSLSMDEPVVQTVLKEPIPTVLVNTITAPSAPLAPKPQTNATGGRIPANTVVKVEDNSNQTS